MDCKLSVMDSRAPRSTVQSDTESKSSNTVSLFVPSLTQMLSIAMFPARSLPREFVSCMAIDTIVSGLLG